MDTDYVSADKKEEPVSAPEAKKAGSLGGVIDNMTSRLAFRVGFFSGALILAAVLFVFLFVLFGLNKGEAKLPGTGGTGTDTVADAGDGALPSPYEELSGEFELRDDDHVRGDRNADLLLVEYSDFECPFCKRFHDTAKTLNEEGIDGQSVAWVYRHFPLSFHEGASEAAQASECVAELGGNDAFWAFTDGYYENTVANGNGYARTKWADLAIESGMPAFQRAAFESCVDTGKYADNVEEETEGGTDLGVTGTPGNILVNQKTGEARLISGAYPIDAFGEAALLLQ